jgi:glycosyltransferase involved in cell wall biosynthesis
MSRLLVAAPVFNRAWALPDWYRHLSEQTVRPDEVMLVHGGARGDDTWEVIAECAANYGLTTHRVKDHGRVHERNDNERFRTLARVRNQMLAMATVLTDADYLLSLDTDIMLEDPETIARLLGALDRVPGGYSLAGFWPDVSSCLTHFHPSAQWTRNAGYLGNTDHHPQEAIDAGRPEDLADWAWSRANIEPEFEHGGIQPIDIAMGILLMPRRVFARVRYKHHKAGEDIGFAINLKLAGLTAGWIPSLYARHVWSPDKL